MRAFIAFTAAALVAFGSLAQQQPDASRVPKTWNPNNSMQMPDEATRGTTKPVDPRDTLLQAQSDAIRKLAERLDQLDSRLKALEERAAKDKR